MEQNFLKTQWKATKFRDNLNEKMAKIEQNWKTTSIKNDKTKTRMKKILRSSVYFVTISVKWEKTKTRAEKAKL